MERCDNCNKEIPLFNIELHKIRCEKLIFQCECGDIVSRADKDRHSAEKHTPEACSRCGKVFERGLLDMHPCPKADVTCPYCEAIYPKEFFELHVRECGNRTELCLTCLKYIPFKLLSDHHCLNSPPIPVYEPSVIRQSSMIKQPESNLMDEAMSSYRRDHIMEQSYIRRDRDFAMKMERNFIELDREEIDELLAKKLNEEEKHFAMGAESPSTHTEDTTQDETIAKILDETDRRSTNHGAAEDRMLREAIERSLQEL